jgi:large subunit ribosomal protein L7/L12
MADLAKLVEEIKGLTLMEASELVKMLEEELGVTAAVPMAAMAMPGGMAGAVEEEVEEQTEFDVRQLTPLGLKEAKEVVDGAPSTILEKVTKEVAEDAKTKLEAEGAVVEVK